MSENIAPRYGVSRVDGDTLDLLEDEEVRIMTLSILQCSVIRQMVFPWAHLPTRLVDEHVDYWEIVEQPTAYKEALEALELMVGGGYIPPEEEVVGEIYHDVGDKTAWDKSIGAGLTADSAWHDLDLSALVTDATATRVLIIRYCVDNVVNANFFVDAKGNLNHYNDRVLSVQAANVYNYGECQIPLSADLKIQYKIDAGMNAAGLSVSGWWAPVTG